MEPLLQLTRTILIVIPCVLWTIIWPILLIGSKLMALISILLGLAAVTLNFVILCPFAFISAVFSNQSKLNEHFNAWEHSYCQVFVNASKIASTIKIGSVYTILHNWVESTASDKGDDAGCLVIVANSFGGIMILFALFEVLRPFIIIGIILLVALFIWGALQ